LLLLFGTYMCFVGRVPNYLIIIVTKLHPKR
jgi:hypothetical protein